MESKINYTLVGLFVVVLLSGLSGIVYWLQQHGGKQDYDYYHVYISESVAGLSPNASVKYMGVEIGTVEQMEINPENPAQVVLLLKIKHSTPIKVDTKATLKFFGITGLAYIEFSGSSKNSPRLNTADGTIPSIPATPSTFAEIGDSLRVFSAKSGHVLDKLDRLLNEKNLQNIKDILVEIKNLNRDIKQQIPGFQSLLTNGVIMEQNMSRAFKKVETASVSVDKMATNLEKTYASVGHNMDQNVEKSFESFNHLIQQITILTNELQTTVLTIKASPSDLLFKHTEIKPGPGEKGYNEK